MDLAESISFQMDTTSESDSPTTANASASSKPTNNIAKPALAKSSAELGASSTAKPVSFVTLRRQQRLSYDDELTRLSPDKIIVVDETPPSSSSSSHSATNSPSPPISVNSPQQPPDNHLNHDRAQMQSQPKQATGFALSMVTACTSSASSSVAIQSASTLAPQSLEQSNQQQQPPHSQPGENNYHLQQIESPRTRGKKSVLFDTVTVYHFNRSQGFVSIPSQGGSTLGMKRKHFLRRRLKVDLYEEVRRRSRREILLKIKFDKRKRKQQEDQQRQQQLCDDRLNNCNSNSSSTSSTSITNTSDTSDDESYSEFSDISDSELESDSFIFLQPIGVKLRRSLLRASGVGRIDPREKKECKTIRESRDTSGCKCVDQCIPEYCECSRLGVNCHVDRISFPCGCISGGCRNPQGRTEFDIARVRGHFEDKVIRSPRKSENPTDT